MGGDTAAKHGGFVGFEERRLAVAGVGAPGASHAPAAMLQVAPGHAPGYAPGCQQCKRCPCWPVACTRACCNKNHGLFENKPNCFPVPKPLARKQQGREEGNAPAVGRAAGKGLVY